MQQPLLQVKDLCRYFGSGSRQVRAVDGISFEIRKGEVFGLVGESGCGKTTTGRCIMNICGITSGSISFRGQEIGAVEGKGRRPLTGRHGRIQMIFQDPVASLNPRMTVREIISEGLVIRGVRDRKELDRRVCEMLELVGLMPSHAGRYPHEFSGGQRQRIGIARSLIMEPELLIADEPVSALDVSVQAQVINLLNDLRKQLHLTILFIAHDLSVVKYFSDRIGVMYRGKLVELAPSRELFAAPFHPYTEALLSAVPQPDPILEKHRVRKVYDPAAAENMTVFREISPEHFALCSDGKEKL